LKHPGWAAAGVLTGAQVVGGDGATRAIGGTIQTAGGHLVRGVANAVGLGGLLPSESDQPADPNAPPSAGGLLGGADIGGFMQGLTRFAGNNPWVVGGAALGLLNGGSMMDKMIASAAFATLAYLVTGFLKGDFNLGNTPTQSSFNSAALGIPETPRTEPLPAPSLAPAIAGPSFGGPR